MATTTRSAGCPVRPRFHCGQLLTDQDLEALVGWARDRLALGHAPHGWGVVCGLDVRCDPAGSGWVVLGPGHAVTGAGDDVVVCAEHRIDLNARISRPAARCAGPPAPPAGPVPPPVLDLYLSYGEQDADPQTTLGGGGCGCGSCPGSGRSGCAYGRAVEGHVLTACPVEPGDDPATRDANRWRLAYRASLRVLDRFQERFGEPGENDAAAVLLWLRGWLQQHPPHQFAVVAHRLGDHDPEKPPALADLVRELFWIAVDERNAFLAADCPAHHDPDPGVPIARVWLAPEAGGYRVSRIDTHPPYRRPLTPHAWPAGPGQVNLGRYLWHRRWDGCLGLKQLGFPPRFTPVEVPRTAREAAEMLGREPFTGCDDTPVVETVKFEGDDHIVAISAGRAREVGTPVKKATPARRTR